MNRQNVQRTQVKDGFDPLNQIKKKHDEKSVQVKKQQIIENDEESISDSIKNSNTQKEDDNSIRVLSNVDENSLNFSSSLPIKNNTQSSLNSQGIHTYNFTNTTVRDSSFFIDRESIKNTFDLLRGETIIDYDEAYYRFEDANLIGTIVMTDFRVLFKFKEESLMEKLNFDLDNFKIPFYSVAKIEKTNDKKNMTRYSIDISTKDYRNIKFIISSDQLKFYANLNNFVFPREYSLNFTFAFKFREASYEEVSFVDGWKIYDPISEYKRQGIQFDDSEYKLRMINLNKNFTLCPTYPQILFAPKVMTDEEVKEASLFRTKNRFPVLSYVYNGVNGNKNNSSKVGYSYASIWRSSQTKSGLTGQNRSQCDEKLLKSISQLNDKLVIYDARPYINALANRIKGGGFENVNNYSNTELHFCEIENIHNVRNSLNKIFTLCSNNKIMENKKFLSGLEQTDWYEFIHLIIKYSNEIALSIKKNCSVLVHCSDGWDRSSQLISLSEILIDPYYRTIEGLIVLIEKEWLSFGHQFAIRNGLYLKEPSEDQRAPIFLQWLDCLHQLISQFPNAFEFNLELLLFLALNYNTNLYGTFLYNCEMERFEKDAKNKTVSIWTDIYSKIDKFRNPYFKGINSYGILTPNYAPFKMRFWEEFFLKWNNSIEDTKLHFSDQDGKLSNTLSIKSAYNFYQINKIQTNLKEEIISNKIDDILRVLLDVYEKTKDESIFDSFEETTKFYLSNLNSK